jgi:cell division septation protein DedD
MSHWFYISGTSILVALALNSSRAGVNFISRPLPVVQEMAANEGKLYFVYFSAKWSMVCTWMENNTYLDPSLSDYVNKHYIAVKLDIDDPYGQKCQEEFNIQQIPAILVFNPQGKLIARKDYSEGPETLTLWFRQQREQNPAQPASPAQITDAPVYPAARKSPDTSSSKGSLNRPALKPEVTGSATSSPDTNAPATSWSSPPHTSQQEVSSSFFTIQTGVFGDYSNALQEVRRQENILRQPVDIGSLQQANGKMMYRITLGSFRNREEAALFLQHLQGKSIQGFIRPLGNQ